jgi:hypothetical protein
MKRWYVYFGTAALLAGVLLVAAGFWLGWASRPEESMARSTPRTIYVVQEFSWRVRSSSSPGVQDDERSGRPVLAFSDRARTDAHCQQLNLQKRATTNPFYYIPKGADYTSMDPASFLAFLRAEGLTPPTDFFPDDALTIWTWALWWDEHRSKWDERLVERIWNALDRLSFYEVLEVPVVP